MAGEPALAAGETAAEALFHQAGVIRVGTLKEMFDVATVLSAQPVPAGRRVAVLTNGGGPGILGADGCEAAGLLVPELSDNTQAALRAGLPPQASVRNPVDTVASATAEQYAQALRLLGAAEEVDAIIAVYIPAFVPAEDVAREITAADTDVDEMLRSLRSYRLLTGYRQSPPLDVTAFAELLHRVSAMVEDIPEIAELDLNPVFVRQHGAVVADVRVRLTG